MDISEEVASTLRAESHGHPPCVIGLQDLRQGNSGVFAGGLPNVAHQKFCTQRSIGLGHALHRPPRYCSHGQLYLRHWGQ